MLLQRSKKMKSLVPEHHIVQQEVALLQQSRWECIKHPLYSSDFALGDLIAIINTNVPSIDNFY